MQKCADQHWKDKDNFSVHDPVKWQKIPKFSKLWKVFQFSCFTMSSKMVRENMYGLKNKKHL